MGVWVRDLETNGRVTLGYWLVPSQRGSGLTVSALALATRWTQDVLTPIRCQVFIEPWNVASWRSAEQVGCEREGLLRKWEKINDEWRDLYAYSIVSE